jgi:methenyltetrahydrofolate cyclohydrolase (EC 3.5.4.9)/5,10-methylenetetrahydrofolate dehydrogenase (NADP+) (EC 1.5.1.5)
MVKGDVDFENVKNKCKLITPVPGGVGPVTVAMVVKNLINCCKSQLK